MISQKKNPKYLVFAALLFLASIGLLMASSGFKNPLSQPKQAPSSSSANSGSGGQSLSQEKNLSSADLSNLEGSWEIATIPTLNEHDQPVEETQLTYSLLNHSGFAVSSLVIQVRGKQSTEDIFLTLDNGQEPVAPEEQGVFTSKTKLDPQDIESVVVTAASGYPLTESNPPPLLTTESPMSSTPPLSDRQETTHTMTGTVTSWTTSHFGVTNNLKQQHLFKYDKGATNFPQGLPSISDIVEVEYRPAKDTNEKNLALVVIPKSSLPETEQAQAPSNPKEEHLSAATSTEPAQVIQVFSESLSHNDLDEDYITADANRAKLIQLKPYRIIDSALLYDDGHTALLEVWLKNRTNPSYRNRGLISFKKNATTYKIHDAELQE